MKGISLVTITFAPSGSSLLLKRQHYDLSNQRQCLDVCQIRTQKFQSLSFSLGSSFVQRNVIWKNRKQRCAEYVVESTRGENQRVTNKGNSSYNASLSGGNASLSGGSESTGADKDNASRYASRKGWNAGRRRPSEASSSRQNRLNGSSMRKSSNTNRGAKMSPSRQASQPSAIEKMIKYVKRGRSRTLSDHVEEELSRELLQDSENTEEVPMRSKSEWEGSSSHHFKEADNSADNRGGTSGNQNLSNATARTSRGQQSELGIKNRNDSLKQCSRQKRADELFENKADNTEYEFDQESDGTVDPVLTSMLRNRRSANPVERTSFIKSDVNENLSDSRNEWSAATASIGGLIGGTERKFSVRSGNLSTEPIDTLFKILHEDEDASKEEFTEAGIYSEEADGKLSSDAEKDFEGEKDEEKKAYAALFSIARSGSVKAGRPEASPSTVGEVDHRRGASEGASLIARKPARLKYSSLNTRRLYPHYERATPYTRRRDGSKRGTIDDFLVSGDTSVFKQASIEVGECVKCDGSGLGECKGCNGDIWLGNDELGWVQCNVCNGMGNGLCNDCGGSGKKGVWGFDRSEWRKIFGIPGLEMFDDDYDKEEFADPTSPQKKVDTEEADTAHMVNNDDNGAKWASRSFDEGWDGLERYVGVESDTENVDNEEDMDDLEEQNVLEVDEKSSSVVDDLESTVLGHSEDDVYPAVEFDEDFVQGVEDGRDVNFKPDRGYETVSKTSGIEVDDEEDLGVDEQEEGFGENVIAGAGSDEDYGLEEEKEVPDVLDVADEADSYNNEVKLNETIDDTFVELKEYEHISEDDLEETFDDNFNGELD